LAYYYFGAEDFMKRMLRTTIVAVPLVGVIGVALNCSSTGTGTYVPVGGSSGSTGSDTGSSTGSSSGETSGNSGSTSGATGTAAATGTSGATGTAAATGTSGATGTAAATGTSGATGSSGAGADDGGGATGTTGATGTSGAADAGGATVDTIFGNKNTYGESVKNSFILFPCYSQNLQDCITYQAACPNQDTTLPMEQQGFTTHEYFTLGGTPGNMYSATFTVHGVSEAKYYMDGTRFAGNGDPPNPYAPAGIDTFYTGGTPVNVENYNIYKITVWNAAAPGADAGPGGTGTEVQHYYLNSFPQTATPYEYHETFPISWTHQIAVPGGGIIEYSTADRNCRAVDNCGPGFRTTPCTGAGTSINIPSDPSVVIPMTYMGQQVSSLNLITGATQPYHSQTFHITVTAVAPM